MDKYFLAIVVLIIFSVIVVLCLKTSKKIAESKSSEMKLLPDIDSISYDQVTNRDPLGPLSNLKANDFTLLE